MLLSRYRYRSAATFTALVDSAQSIAPDAVNHSKAGMAARFLKRLLERFCRHEFSWPHSGSDGQDYQVCLICGTIYEYDLATMRRTRRLPTSLRRTEFNTQNEHGG